MACYTRTVVRAERINVHIDSVSVGSSRNRKQRNGDSEDSHQ
jgi:hypothetical protein